MRSPDPRLRPDPEKTGKCYCGCGEPANKDKHFRSNHDSTALAKFLHIHYGSIAALLAEHGYGPSGVSLFERHAEKCKRPPGKDTKKQCKYKQSGS